MLALVATVARHFPSSTGTFHAMFSRMVFAIVAVPFVLRVIRHNLVPSGAGSNRLEAFGLHELNGIHLRLITDLPVDDEIRLLPTIFDAAMPQWADYFRLGTPSIEEGAYSDWKATAMLIGDRSRFQQAGLLTPDIPDFRDGYQSTGRIFLMEQPSAYYRRHLPTARRYALDYVANVRVRGPYVVHGRCCGSSRHAHLERWHASAWSHANQQR